MKQADVMRWLRAHASPRVLAGMARYGIPSKGALGVTMGEMLKFAKRQEKDHALAAALWKTRCYEARILASMLDDPQRVTPAQMDAWARQFDSWALCDTVCWNLFYETRFVWEKARAWSKSPREFVKRAGFAMMAGLVTHDKAASDGELKKLFPLIEKGARDERNFVQKGVSWALRRIATRNLALLDASVAVASRLSQSPDAGSRWVGRDALRAMQNPKMRMSLEKRAQKAKRKA